MKLAILAVLLIIAYLIWTNVQKIIANRQEANAHARQQKAQSDIFSQGLSRLEEARDAFFDRTGHLDPSEQQKLWSEVVDDKVRACHFYLKHDFNRATAFLSLAIRKADGLIAQYQAM